MTISKLVSELESSTTKTKIVHDFKSKYTQICTWEGATVWAGNVNDLAEDELNFEVIPNLLEAE